MPANKKYLSASPWYKLGKLSAAILGGLFVSISLHAALAAWTDAAIVRATVVFSGFIIWVAFMLLTYWIIKVWHVWALIFGIMLVCAIVIYLGE